MAASCAVQGGSQFWIQASELVGLGSGTAVDRHGQVADSDRVAGCATVAAAERATVGRTRRHQSLRWRHIFVMAGLVSLVVLASVLAL